MVPEVGLCASRAVGLRSAQRLWRSGAPRPLQKPHRGFCDTGLRVPDRKTKTAPLGRPLFWCRKWDSALRVRSACAPRSACGAAALPGPYKSPTGAFAIRGFESLIAKQKPPRWGGLCFGAGSGTLRFACGRLALRAAPVAQRRSPAPTKAPQGLLRYGASSP